MHQQHSASIVTPIVPLVWDIGAFWLASAGPVGVQVLESGDISF